jgi:two-component system, NtrC family, response regulator PilR
MQKILLVDDEAMVRESIELILEKEGYSIESVASGEEALESCEIAPYDLVITDMKMHGLNGQEFAERLKHIKPRQKIILATAFPPAESGEVFSAVLLKPFSPVELRCVVRTVLSHPWRRPMPHSDPVRRV